MILTLSALEDRARPGPHLAGGERQDMLGQRHVRPWNQVRQAGVDHPPRPIRHLFRGLEQGDVGAGPGGFAFRHKAGGAEQAGDVHVVAAGVGHRYGAAAAVRGGVRAGIGQPGVFGHGERVHVGAHQHGGPVAVAQDADDPGGADVLVHHVAEVPQQAGRQGCRPGLLMAQFGVPVQVFVEFLLPCRDPRRAGGDPGSGRTGFRGFLVVVAPGLAHGPVPSLLEWLIVGKAQVRNAAGLKSFRPRQPESTTTSAGFLSSLQPRQTG